LHWRHLRLSDHSLVGVWVCRAVSAGRARADCLLHRDCDHNGCRLCGGPLMLSLGRIFQELAGLAIATAGGLPLFEILRTGSVRWRNKRYRTTRKEDPVGYWGVVGVTA